MTWAVYPETKESGIYPIGSIPSHWSMPHLGHIASCLDYLRIPLNSVERADMPGDVPYWGANGVVDAVAKSLVGGPLVLLGEDGAPFFDRLKDKAFFVDSPIWPNNHIHVLRPGPLVSGQFLAHALNATDYAAWIEGSTRDKLTQSNMTSIPIPLPPIEEQQAIVAFLTEQIASIDTLIAKQEQLIVTLREDRIATITHAVTKGLDRSVDLVQPHNSALPTCPSHWTAQIRLKRLAEVQTGVTLGKSVDPAEAVEVPYLRVANVQTSGVDLNEVKTVAVHRSELSRYLLNGGDVLMTEGGDIDKLGRGCIWSGEISPCIHQNHVFAVRCKDTLSSAFLVYLLDTAVARNYFFMTAKKTTNLASTNSTTLGAFTFSLPPRAEQDKIVRHLNERCERLDALIAKANAVIEVLREYRSALITDAVTGKIDVREAVA